MMFEDPTIYTKDVLQKMLAGIRLESVFKKYKRLTDAGLLALLIKNSGPNRPPWGSFGCSVFWPRVLVHFDDPPLELVALAAQRGQGSLLDIPEEKLTYAICLTAVSNGDFLFTVPEKFQDVPLITAAVRCYAENLSYVPEAMKTTEVCLAAVKQNGRFLSLVREELQTEEIRMAALLKHPPAICLLRRPSAEEVAAVVGKELTRRYGNTTGILNGYEPEDVFKILEQTKVLLQNNKDLCWPCFQPEPSDAEILIMVESGLVAGSHTPGIEIFPQSIMRRTPDSKRTLGGAIKYEFVGLSGKPHKDII